MATRKQLEIHSGDQAPQKWCVSLGEEVFKKFLSQGSSTVLHKVFNEGSLFSPLLFGKFFDPSDAFPLWDFESDSLLSKIRSSGQSTTVDWSQTDQEYVLKAELPGKKPKFCSLSSGSVILISKTKFDSNVYEPIRIKQLSSFVRLQDINLRSRGISP